MSVRSTILEMSCSNERMASVGVNRVRINTRKTKRMVTKSITAATDANTYTGKAIHGYGDRQRHHRL
jgi:hypothetical protein